MHESHMYSIYNEEMNIKQERKMKQENNLYGNTMGNFIRQIGGISQ